MRITRGTRVAVSNESSRMELTVGSLEGKVYGAALSYLTTMEATDSGETAVGDYLVTYSIEDAEGLYHLENGDLVWHEPEQENCHLEIAVRNASDGRFIPCLDITATLSQPDGQELGTCEMPFLWHPWVYHYGRNWTVPKDGTYHLRVEIATPDFPRHDRVNGKRFAQPVTVNFEVKIKTGTKSSNGS